MTATAARTQYSELLRHPLWQQRRLEKLNATGWRCEHCRRNDIELHVHHKEYVAGRLPWEYSNDELVTVCKNCHAIEHLPKLTNSDIEAQRFIDSLHLELINEADPVEKRRIWAAYAAAIRERTKPVVRRMELQRGLAQ